MARLEDVIDELRRRITELERKSGSQFRVGVVRDPDSESARVELQRDGNGPFLTGRLPSSEPSAGANKTHNPLSEDQQVLVFSESGNLHDAIILGSLNSDTNQRPSNATDEQVLASIGLTRISITGGGSAATISVGASSITLTNAGIVIAAPRLDLP